jgi:hypothetical protein
MNMLANKPMNLTVGCGVKDVSLAAQNGRSGA